MNKKIIAGLLLVSSLIGIIMPVEASTSCTYEVNLEKEKVQEKVKEKVKENLSNYIIEKSNTKEEITNQILKDIDNSGEYRAYVDFYNEDQNYMCVWVVVADSSYEKKRGGILPVLELHVNFGGEIDCDSTFINKKAVDEKLKSITYTNNYDYRWVKDENNLWSVLNKNGDKILGWYNDNGTWYYLGKSGIMRTGWVNIEDKWYYFSPSGAMQYNKSIDGFWLGSDGAWIQ